MIDSGIFDIVGGMVSFSLSYHTDSESHPARLLVDALSARVGEDHILRGDPSLVESSADLRRRLSASAALVVVIGPQFLSVLRDPSAGLHEVVTREIETAYELKVRIVAVLVENAELPAGMERSRALRALRSLWTDQRRLNRRFGPRWVSDSVDRLVDELATGPLGRVGPVIPLVLSEEPVRVGMPPRAHPGAAVVYLTRHGDLEVAEDDPPTGSPKIDARYSIRYEVDAGGQQASLGLRLPTLDEDYFEASFAVDFRVTGAAEVVRHSVRDAAARLRCFLLDICRPISLQFTVEQGAEAEEAIDRRLARHPLVTTGVTLSRRYVFLSHPSTHERYRQPAPPRVTAEPPMDWPTPVAGWPTPATQGRPETPSWAGPAQSRATVEPEPTTTPTPDSTAEPDRQLEVRAPARVPVGRDLSVEVRLVTVGRPVHPDAFIAPMPNLIVADAGTPVTVTIHAPAGLRPEGPLQQTVLVTPDDDPDPIRFGFGARTPGLHRVDVTAWAGGTFLGEVSVEVFVADGGPFHPGQPKAAPMGAPSARPREVTMEVRFDRGRYTFQLRSDAALFAPVVERVTTTPDQTVEHTIRKLQLMAGGGSRHGATMAREVLRAAGIQLWSELVPAAVREQFWQVGADMSAFTIATDHDVVPWELLYPLGAEHDDGFLVEQVPVVRRTYGQHRAARVGLRNPRFVLPAESPTGAHEEVATIRAILDAAHSEPITRSTELLTLIRSRASGALHFACHNTFSSTGSFIALDDGRFEPSLLNEACLQRLLQETAPLVFINACRSAGVAPTYTRMLGWAQQFMSSGAGAFVGTLWAVRSDSSARFATAFYRSLAEGVTLGEAALAARVEQRGDPLDPTWLAYTVYGDPFATAAL
ncbi:CHAT domain-containing protein [Micromonospora sp. NPDC049044]|uniref:CHAT domain-containing protein n=1 Tax=Micromonospora sp. NPDC049044 TaxID=3154827 RepID=UPI0033CF4C09